MTSHENFCFFLISVPKSTKIILINGFSFLFFFLFYIWVNLKCLIQQFGAYIICFHWIVYCIHELYSLDIIIIRIGGWKPQMTNILSCSLLKKISEVTLVLTKSMIFINEYFMMLISLFSVLAVINKECKQ